MSKTEYTKRDFRDLCVEEAVGRIADLEHDVVVYRELVQQALAMVHDRDGIIARERQQRLDLAAEFREFRRRAMADSLVTVTSDSPRSSHWSRRPVTQNRRSSPVNLKRSEPPRPQA